MSGISGVLKSKKEINISGLKKMTDVIKHRGPDDEGFYLWKPKKELFAYGDDTIAQMKNGTKTSIANLVAEQFYLGLGHRALELKRDGLNNHQPMEFSKIIITYNGTIYNATKIRKELISAGYHFNTKSDVEVIINAYRHWGEESVKHFNGSWAFALWDKQSNKLFCSRDRLGEKPFYYYLTEEEFIFGSEIKQLITYGIRPKVNDEILFTFIFYGIHDFSEETFFENIYCLQGGFNLSLEVDWEKKVISANKYKYWDLNVAEAPTTHSYEEEAQLMGQALEKSIASRLGDGVEVGSCLSGGLDSSSVVTLATKQLTNEQYDVKEFKTITACYDENKEVDERYYSDLIVENSGCTNIKVKPDVQHLKANLEKLIWHQDEPFGSLSMFASWCVMESAGTNGIKILLDGQGGDETLLGYERFYAYFLKQKLSEFKIKEFWKEFKLSSENSKLSAKMLIGYFVYFNNRKLRKRRLGLKVSKFLNPVFNREFKNSTKVDDYLEFKNIEEAQKYEITRSINHLLRYEDRNAMAHSVEARVPFLDTNFIEKAVSIPKAYKLRDGWTKAILREYMEDKMPEEVTYRKNKLGFNVPQEKWLNELNDFYKKNLLENTRSARYFNIEEIKEIFNNKTNSDMRFKFIVVETWMRVFDIKE